MLSVQNLSFGFRHRRLFHGVSLELRRGEMLHLAGPNGAGKSTFMAIVAGLLHADAGEVLFYPGDGAKAPVDDRRYFLEYLPAEANGLFLKMDATHNLLFWAKLRGQDVTADAVFAALARWNLDHPLLRDNFAVEKFSTGMKRRLALARLSLSPAPLWLLDEPLYGLDTQATAVFHDLLKAHLAAGGSALVVSHDLKPIEGLITRTLTLTPATGKAGAAP